MKHRIEFIFVLLLICAGLFLIINSSITVNSNSEAKYEKLHEKSSAALEDAKVEAQSSSPALNVSIDNEEEVKKETNTGDVLGEITIPSVDINLAIIEGSTDENLYKGATTLIEGKTMGEGNYSLAGHHMKDESLFFSQLENIKSGEKIYLTDNEFIYTYIATEQLLINASEVEILNNHGNKNEITLITCDKPTATDQRTVVKGELENKEAFTSHKWNELNEK